MLKEQVWYGYKARNFGQAYRQLIFDGYRIIMFVNGIMADKG